MGWLSWTVGGLFCFCTEMRCYFGMNHSTTAHDYRIPVPWCLHGTLKYSTSKKVILWYVSKTNRSSWLFIAFVFVLLLVSDSFLFLCNCACRRFKTLLTHT